MADIRNSGLLDDTDARSVPENPLSYGGRWDEYGSWSSDLALYDLGPHNAITLSDQSPGHPQQSHFYWTPTTWSGDVEVWARVSAPLEDGASSSLGLISDAGGYGANWDGYHGRINNTFSTVGDWEIWRIDNGGGTRIALLTNYGSMLADQYVLFRRNGNALELWESLDDAANWTLVLSEDDTNYTGAMSLSVGHSVASITNYPGWYYVGGGLNENRPQFYRWIKN